MCALFEPVLSFLCRVHGSAHCQCSMDSFPLHHIQHLADVQPGETIHPCNLFKPNIWQSFSNVSSFTSLQNLQCRSPTRSTQCGVQAIAQARHKTRLSLQIMRFATVTLWSSFPILWTLVELGLVSHPTDEICWCLFDFLGKAIFSTSLLHGNYATMEQRRLVAMTGKLTHFKLKSEPVGKRPYRGLVCKGCSRSVEKVCGIMIKLRIQPLFLKRRNRELFFVG